MPRYTLAAPTHEQARGTAGSVWELGSRVKAACGTIRCRRYLERKYKCGLFDGSRFGQLEHTRSTVRRNVCGIAGSAVILNYVALTMSTVVVQVAHAGADGATAPKPSIVPHPAQMEVS
ncbi:MAG: hypothetical protein JSU86_18395, partial [Phycisphaerales bacterium]